MYKLRTYGLSMNGIKKVSGLTENFGYGSPLYYEVFYDISDGKVWALLQSSIGHNTWTVYHDEDIIKIGNYSKHATMQELADAIASRVAERKNYGRA